MERNISTAVIVAHYMNMMNTVVLTEEEKGKKRPKRWWVRDIFKNREYFGHSNALINEMLLSDHESFCNYTRLTFKEFEKLLSIVGPRIRKTSIRKALPPRDRLIITLRFLATGMSYASLSYSFRVSKTTIHRVLKETSEQIWESCFDQYNGTPKTEDFLAIADKYWLQAGLPNCVGAIDGKHCTIQAPIKSGSVFYNYKKTFSIVLLGVCDVDCNFTYVNVGAYGSESDGGIFKKTDFGRNLIEDKLCFPSDKPLPNTDIAFPYYIIGDEAFPLKRRLLRPYGGRNLTFQQQQFNTRLSSARRTIENTFGILVSQFRIFHTTIIADVENAKSFVKATVILHNFIRKNRYADCFLPSRNAHRELQHINQMGSNFYSNEAAQLRDILKNFLNRQ